MKRIVFARRALGAFALTMTSGAGVSSAAENYPDRPITIIVPWGAGGGSDQMARAVSKVLQDILKSVSVPVINVPGANGNDGMIKLIENDADGYTLAVFVGDTFVGNILSKTPATWEMKDIIPLAVMNRQPFAYYVAQTGPYKTWADVEKAAKQKPFKVALSGFGGAEDAVTTFFAHKGLSFVGVPFAKPGERYAAVLGGQVDMMCDPDGNVRRYVQAGQLNAVLVFSPRRVAEIPGAQTAKEVGYDIVLSEWRGLVVKAGTPSAKVEFLSRALAGAYESPEFQEFVKSSWSVTDSYIPAKAIPAFLSSQERQLKTLVAAGGRGK